MEPRHVAALAILVLLAGCGSILGGSGTPTGSPTGPATSETALPTATATPSPTATPTATPTSTPLPEGFTTRTVTNESLGTTFELVGDRGVLRSVLTADITGHRITRGPVLECSRASPYVAISTNDSVADLTTTMRYNESMLPENANESEIAIFAYNRTVKFYLHMESTVDTENNTVTATSVLPGQAFTRETDNGTEEIEPTVDGNRLNNAFVVMHYPTFWEGVNTQEVPDHCGAGD